MISHKGEFQRTAVRIATIFFVAMAARCWGLFRETPSLDEMWTSLSVMAAPSKLITSERPETCPLLLWLLLALPGHASGATLEVLRLTGAIIGAVACAIVPLVFKKQLSPPGAMAAGMALALHPAVVVSAQEITPALFLLPAALGVCYYFHRTCETNLRRHWFAYDIALWVLLSVHRAGLIFLGVFFCFHIYRLAFSSSRPQDRARVLSRGVSVRRCLAHYGAVAAVSVPFGYFAWRNVPWDVHDTDLWTLREGFRWLLTGFPSDVPLFTAVLTACLGLFIVPAFALIRSRSVWPGLFWAGPALFVSGALLGVLPRMPRFSGLELAQLAAPPLILAAGAAVGHIRVDIRRTMCVVAIFIYGGALQATFDQQKNLPFGTALAAVSVPANPENERIVLWPDYTLVAGRYYLGPKVPIATADEVINRIQELPADTTTQFVVSRWPDTSEIAYTFRGALSKYGECRVVSFGPRLDLLSARRLDRPALSGWLTNPRTLALKDTGGPETMYLFAAGNSIFEGNAFVDRPAEALYDSAGRRVVWTAKEEMTLPLGINLSQGSYELRLHCSASVDETTMRSVEVSMRVFNEEKQWVVDRETTLTLPFTTFTDTTTVAVHLTAEPLAPAGSGRARRLQGLKIYSLSVEMPGATPL